MAIIAKGVKASKPEKTTKNFEEKISKKILNLLGRPRDMKRINAINVFGTRYRVNVWCDTALGCVITHSYFVVVDEDGKILSTNPGIEKNES